MEKSLPFLVYPENEVALNTPGASPKTVYLDDRVRKRVVSQHAVRNKMIAALMIITFMLLAVQVGLNTSSKVIFGATALALLIEFVIFELLIQASIVSFKRRLLKSTIIVYAKIDHYSIHKPYKRNGYDRVVLQFSFIAPQSDIKVNGSCYADVTVVAQARTRLEANPALAICCLDHNWYGIL